MRPLQLYDALGGQAMCPLCVMSAILLAGSVGSACGINWMTAKHREKDEKDADAGSLSLLRGDGGRTENGAPSMGTSSSGQRPKESLNKPQF
jgi:hypothetical protein